jgi:Family of unknown function (DUF6069)
MAIQRSSTRWRKRLLAVVGGILAAEVIWLLATFALGIHVQAPAGNGYPQPVDIGPGTVGITAGVLSLLGWGVLALLERFTRRAGGIWLAFSLLALIVSLSMPLSGGGVPAADRAALVLTHVAVAAIIIPAFCRTSRRKVEQLVETRARRPLGEAA